MIIANFKLAIVGAYHVIKIDLIGIIRRPYSRECDRGVHFSRSLLLDGFVSVLPDNQGHLHPPGLGSKRIIFVAPFVGAAL